jgi:hypothetical protein
MVKSRWGDQTQQGGDDPEAGNAGAVRQRVRQLRANRGPVDIDDADAETYVRAKIHDSAQFDRSGHLVNASADVTFEIRTTYRPGVDPNEASAYGMGTRAEDVAAGNTSIGFHEGKHVQVDVGYISDHPLPEFSTEAGMSRSEYRSTVTQFRSDISDYVNQLGEYSKQMVDCVGTPASFCH